MNLIVFNMSNSVDWEGGVVNRNYFITEQLKANKNFDKILFIDFLSQQPFKKLFGRKRALKYALKGKKLRSFGKNKYIYQGLNLFTSNKKFVSKINKLANNLGFDLNNTVVWSYNAFLPEAFDLKAKIKVFDAVDNWSLHASYKQEASSLKENYKIINQKADKIFTVSEGLLDLFDSKKTKWVPNGIDLDVFKKVENISLPYKKPIIGYIGTIQERLDFDLIEKILRDHKEKSFVFIGPVWKGVQTKVDELTKNHNNIFFLGRKAYKEVPSYLAAMDIAIIPHRLDAFINSTNPMKMYDYLAAGKAVVTTPGAGTDDFADYLFIHGEEQAFSDAISEALKANSQDEVKSRKESVNNHGWDKRVNTMIEFLLQ